MALAHSPKLVTDGLVFYFDQGNTQKSWKGKPATNFFTNGHFLNGNGITQESGSTATNAVIYYPANPGDSAYVLQQNGTNAEYQINLTTELSSSTTYCMSGWYAESPSYNGTSTMFHSRAFSSSGAHVALGFGIGTTIEERVVNGITWKYVYATITTPSDYSNSFNWYVGYGATNTVGYRYYTNLMMEVGSYPSRFVNGTRSNTQALIDLTRNNTITANNLTYNSNGSFSFGGSDRLNFTLSGSAASTAYTRIVWIKPTILNTADVKSVILNTIGNNSDMAVGIGNYGYPAFHQYTKTGTSGTTDGDYNAYGSTLLTANNTYMIAVTVNRNSSTNNINIYLNGKLDGTASLALGTAASDAVIIGGPSIDPYSGARMFYGDCYAAMHYNRVLSATEIAQNFNALRGRYGV